MFIKIMIEKIKANPQIHHIAKLFIIKLIPAITKEPKIRNNKAVLIVSFINKEGVIFEKPYFLFNLKVEYNSKGSPKTQFIIIKLFTKTTAFNNIESI